MVVVASVASSVTPSPHVGETRHTPTHIETQLGAVAADEPRCSVIGASVLDDGGSAVDAAIATALCLGVVHPHSSGVGGGAFMVVYDAGSGSSEVIEFREEAPSGASRDMYSNTSNSNSDGEPGLRASEFGGSAVAVPSELFGLRLAWERHGTLPWRRLVTPAVALAESFPIGLALAQAIEEEKEPLSKLPGAKQLFLNPDGSCKKKGDTVKNPRLAETLRKVAESGADVLRTEELAESLARDIQDAGGLVTQQDLEQYEPRILRALEFSALGYDMLGVPPPSSGGATVGIVLEFLAGYNDGRTSDRTLQTHRLAEAMKHAFALRMNLGDNFLAAFDTSTNGNSLNVSGALHDMLDPNFVAYLRSITNDNYTLPIDKYGAQWNAVEDHGTTHISVLDASGNAVAMTSTINTLFGSKVVSPSTGILLNNQMDDFSVPGEANHYGLEPSAANFIAPRKKPLSSMSPTIVLDKTFDPPKVVAVAGASGGPRIITAVAQVLLNLLSRDMSPLDSIDAPRIHHQLLPNVLFAEDQVAIGDGTPRKFDFEIVEALRQKGHAVEFSSQTTATAQLIAVDTATGVVHAVSDARKGGKPAAQRKVV